jgi:hypothetical protein
MMLMDNKSHYNNLNLLYTKCTIKALSKFPSPSPLPAHGERDGVRGKGDQNSNEDGYSS